MVFTEWFNNKHYSNAAQVETKERVVSMYYTYSEGYNREDGDTTTLPAT